jgi:UDP-glucose 4-epimerase
LAPAVLVTGGTGFLGSVLISTLLERGDQVVVVSRSAKPIDRRCLVVRAELSDLRELSDLPQLNYAFCFHFAGSSSVPYSWQSPLDDFANTVPGTVSLMHYISRFYPDCHLLVSSSAAVYGNPMVLPVTEDSVLTPISPYGIHKAAVEHLCAHYARLLGQRTTIMRIFSAYGPGLRKQLLWDIARKLMLSETAGLKSISLLGTGLESRDFIHSSDVARAAIFLASDTLPGLYNVVNIASGVETQVRHIAQLLCDNWGDGFSALFTGEARPGDPQRWVADLSLLTGRGFSLNWPLDEGVCSYVAWAKGIFS